MDQYWKAVRKTDKKGVFATGGIGGSCNTLFELGKTYKVEGKPNLCKNGFHFYPSKDFVFGLDLFGLGNTFFIEIEPLSDIVNDTEKCVATKIKTIRYVPKKEWMGKVKNNGNSGDWNSGDWNSGDWNSGDWNSGDRNSGDWNSGDWNSGDWNSGDRNSGDWNSGNRNSGDWNSGDWNSGDYSNGFLNSKDTPFYMFNKLCDRKRDEITFPAFFYFTLDGPYKESWRKSFEKADKSDIEKLLNLPNFDYVIFEDLTGITKKMIGERG